MHPIICPSCFEESMQELKTCLKPSVGNNTKMKIPAKITIKK